MRIIKERKEYIKNSLQEAGIPKNPFDQFGLWFEQAQASHQGEAHAMTLSTCENRQPASRIVLLKAYDESGFVFFTNYNSRKGQALAINPLASLLFFWENMERQIRIEGAIQQVEKKTSDAYFASRPPDSQINAIISPQSNMINGKEELLEARSAFISQKKTPERPANWGGYRLRPHYFEFWQGGPNRLHDRIAYSWREESWVFYRLAP